MDKSKMLTTTGLFEWIRLNILIPDIYGCQFKSAQSGQMHRIFYQRIQSDCESNGQIGRMNYIYIILI
jgi:hypothetical protein